MKIPQHVVELLEDLHERAESSESDHDFLLFHSLHLIITNQFHIMQSLTDLQAVVAAEDTVIDSAIALINGLAEQVAALPADRAAIDALATDIKSKSDALSAAVTAGTPAGATGATGSTGATGATGSTGASGN